jgi:thiol-disulfide isomerase/thioredoxin
MAVGSEEKFDVQKEPSEGRVVVLNFWYTTCSPCLEELPCFYQMATDYAGQVSVAAASHTMSRLPPLKKHWETDPIPTYYFIL